MQKIFENIRNGRGREENLFGELLTFELFADDAGTIWKALVAAEGFPFDCKACEWCKPTTLVWVVLTFAVLQTVVIILDVEFVAVLFDIEFPE